MVKIRITSGVFGWNHGTYDLVRAGDPPIEVDEVLARRLVEEKGVAEYVAPASAEQNDTESAEAEKSLEEMTKEELRELGAQYGLTFNANAKKSEMIEAINAETDDAPTFDAAEAVQ